MLDSSYLPRRSESIPLGIILIGLTPAIIILLPWDFGPDSTDFRAFMRGNMLSTTVVQFAYVLFAMSRGFSPVAMLTSLPRLALVGFGMLAFSAAWTTVFVAVIPIAAILGVAKFLGHFMFGLALAHQMTGWTQRQRNMIWPAIGIGVATFCLLWLLNIIIYHPKGNDWIRLVPSLTTMRSAGPYALASFCAGIGLLNSSVNRHDRAKLLIAVLLGSLGLALAFWTGTRAAVVAIYLATASSLVLLPIRRHLVVLTLMSTFIGLAVVLALPSVHPAYGITRILTDSARAGADSMSSGRVEIWLNMVDELKHRPILGWGIDQFRFSFPAGEPSIRHPHNGIMQLLFSIGLWGLLAYALLAISFIRNLPKIFTQPYQFASITFIIGALSYGAYDGFFYFTYPIMIFAVAIVCVLSEIRLPAAFDKSD